MLRVLCATAVGNSSAYVNVLNSELLHPIAKRGLKRSGPPPGLCEPVRATKQVRDTAVW